MFLEEHSHRKDFNSMANVYDILSNVTGKSTSEIKGSAKEVQLDILVRIVSTLTASKPKILRNIYVPYANGTKTTEIDMMLFANGNIYLFEVKNYSCAVVGNEKDKYWKTIYSATKTYDMYNPIMQNKGHLSTLASYLKVSENKFKSVIVFSENADISKVKYSRNSNLCVLKMNTVLPYLIKQKISKEVFSNSEMETLYNKIKPLTKVSKATKQQHIKDVQSKR